MQTRTFGFVLATVLVALVLGWVGRITWHDLWQLNRSFASAQEDVFRYSDHINASLDDFKDIVLRFDPQSRPGDRSAFQQMSQDSRQWLRAHQAAVSTPSESELMGQIEVAFELYLAQATKLMDERAQAGTGYSPTRTLKQLDRNAAPVLDLCVKLKTVERAAQAQFMEDSRRALFWLQELLIIQLGLLIFLVGTAAVAVYRGVIGPLRIELGESHARAERHEKLASLGTLAASVAHEIRNPLTAINVRLHSLKRNLVENSSEQEDALVIGHEIQRLESIVQEFLEFARPSEPKFVTVSADSLLVRMQALFGPQLEKTGIRLNLESVPDIWVRVDPHQIEQVLINLIRNAGESMKSVGTITLRVRNGSARLQGRARPVVLIEVSDTGTGISPTVRQRIFDPFFTTKAEGTGLGLSIAARIVEKHDGALECRSEENRGTTFTILLPYPKPELSNEISN